MIFSEHEIAQSLDLLHQLDQRVARFGQEHLELSQCRMHLKLTRERLMEFKRLNDNRRAADEKRRLSASQELMNQ